MSRNSERWMPDIQRLSAGFYGQKLNPKLVVYHKNNYPVIDNICDTMTEKVKGEVFPNCVSPNDCLLDWHKIFAVHVMAFLTKKLYTDGDAVSGGSVIDRLANEYLCLTLLKVIAKSWHRYMGEYGDLVMPHDYEQCLIKLFFKYKASGLLDMTDTTFTYALSNIAYLVDRCFWVPY
jgi:hypothetical protein